MAEKYLTVEQILSTLAGTPPRLAALAAGLPPARLRFSPGPGEWSANEILAHLRSCADVWGDSIRAILAADKPVLRAVNPRTWIQRTNYRDLDFEPSLRAFTGQRGELLSLLQALPPESWERAAVVTGAGRPREQTVRSYMDRMARHERPHVRQIELTLAALRRDPPPCAPAAGEPPIEIVRLGPDEWPAYRRLRLEMLQESPQAFGSTYTGALSRPDDFWRSRIESAARGEGNWLLFARSGPRLVGMMGAYYDPPEPEPEDARKADIVSVYVSPSHRGRGISILLMQALLDLLKSQGFRKVRLGVNIEQSAALHLYRRFGFTVTETIHTQMGDGEYHDEVFMERRLD